MTETSLRARRAFGRGLALTPVEPESDIGLDIVFGPLGKDGVRDLSVISGLPILLQDLTVALTSGLGADLLNAAFGSAAFQAMADHSDPFLQREAVKVAVVRVLKADPRVRRILEMRVDAGETAAPGERRTALSLTAVFETVLGERATLEIEE